MSKKQLHLNSDELKSLIKEGLRPIMEKFLGNREKTGSLTFSPGENANISEEEYDEVIHTMQNGYWIGFTFEKTGDGRNEPEETYIVPDENDVRAVRADIAKIQNENLRKKIEQEFEEWLTDAEPGMDYSENDPDEYRDGLYENESMDVSLDSHFNNPDQIAKDKKSDWAEYTKKPEWFGFESEWDANKNNIEGETQYSGEEGYKDLGRGYRMSLASQSDDPEDKWWGQTGRSNMTDTFNASKNWFPADFNDEQYSDSNYKINNMGQINENIKKYIKRLVCEALGDVDGRQYVIQTRTGGYLMEIKGEPTQYSDDVILLYAFVGRSPVCVMVSSDDYNTLINQGQSIEAQYKILAKGGGSTPLQQCSIAPYNA